MLVDIYKSAANESVFVAVPAGTDLAHVTLPDHLDHLDRLDHPDFTTLQLFRARQDVERGENYVAISGGDVLDQIETKGHAVFGAAVTVSHHRSMWPGQSCGAGDFRESRS